MNSINNDFEAKTNPEREILEMWRALRSELEELTRRTAGSLLRSMKFRIMDRIIESAGKYARLSGYDDDLFECARDLTEFYKRAAGHYLLHAAELNTFSIKSMIAGIYKVLSDQLQLFEAQLSGSEDNPVAIERIRLLSAGVAYFMFSFNDYEKGCIDSRPHALELAARLSPGYYETFIERIQRDILDCFIENTYPSYKKAVHACVYALNNLEERKTLSYFHTFLTSQSDALSLVSRQTSDIEQELSRNAGNSLEFNIVRNFLSIVKEAQFFYQTECRNLMAFFQDADSGAVPETEDMESLYAACGDMLANGRLIAEKDYLNAVSKYAADMQAINGCFESSADLFIGRILSGLNLAALLDESGQRAGGMILKAKQAAEAIACVFARQVSFCRENADKFSALNENGIINGINETLIIKTEILADSISALEDITYGLDEAGLELTAKERDPLLKELFPILREKIFAETDGDDMVMDAFYSEAAQTGAIASYRKRVSDACQKEEERIEKAVKRFLKDSVLFEIITFEEILQYSVTRLRESDNDYVRDYIDMIDENAHIIENTLEKTGIAMIRPNPHDSFNGREHEILMAEHIDGFAKGEIIKYMTSGYRLDGQVLIRANVIAAK